MTALAGLALLMGSKQKSCCAKEERCVAAEKAVLETHSKIINAAEKLDAETMFSYILDDDKGAIAQDGRLMARTEALNQIKQAFTQVTSIKYNFQQQNIKMLSPKIALLTATGTTTSTIQSGESFTSTFANTSVFVLRANEWKIIHGHHSIPNFE